MSDISESFFDPINTLELLPCTMENGLFVTNVKWQNNIFIVSMYNPFYVSPELVLNDPIKNEPIKIKLRFKKQPKSNKGRIESFEDNRWKFHSTVDFSYNFGFMGFEFTVGLRNNIYYASKTLMDDLRHFLVAIHGETIAFGCETHSTQDCSKETLLAFIDEEYNEDFVIECGGQEFKIKKIILQARSPVFNAMLSTNFYTEGRDNRMIITDYDSEVVKNMIEFFETDFVRDTIEFVVELYEIARKYMSQSFMEFTRLLFIQKLTIENYQERLKVVFQHDDKETEELMNEWYSKNHQRRL